MRGIWPVQAVRDAEAELMRTVPAGALMQRAAAGLAAHCAGLLDRVYGARVVLLVGAGNNGGDALYAGARLAGRGAAVTAVLLAPDRAHPGGLAALLAAGGRAGPYPGGWEGQFEDGDLVLDGIVGIGGKGGLRPEAAELAARAAGSGATLVAVDSPSGVDCDTGAVDGVAFDADVTVTFGCLKAGLVVGTGAQRAGTVELVDIGLGPHLPAAPARMMDDADVRALLPVPGPGDDKYTRGVLGVVAGSSAYGGAAVLAVGAALGAGVGMVRYAGYAADAIRARWPEVVVTEGMPAAAGRVQAWVAGPGLGTDDHAREQLREVLASDVAVLVDADGITMLGADPGLLHRDPPTVLTPHDREFERVAGAVGDDRIGATRRAAATLGATVLLKGNSTVVAGPDGRTYVNPAGPTWLATAGSGDVLSGTIGALLASGLPPAEAAAGGSYLHQSAAAIASAGGPVSSVDVLQALPAAVRALLAD